MNSTLLFLLKDIEQDMARGILYQEGCHTHERLQAEIAKMTDPEATLEENPTGSPNCSNRAPDFVYKPKEE